jgi:exosortase
MYINNIAKFKYLCFAISIGAFAVPFYPVFLWLYKTYTEQGSFYSHGFVIPLIAIFLIHRKLINEGSNPLSSYWSGTAVLFLGFSLYGVVDGFRNAGFIAGVSFIIVVFGLSLLILGHKITKSIAFPITFLIFMVPPPQLFLLAVTYKLKVLIAGLATDFMSVFNINIRNIGNMIYLPGCTLTVDNQCSGMNSLISLFTLSVAAAAFIKTSMFKRLMFSMSSLPVAIAANITRILILVTIAYIFGAEAATKGILHYGAGIILWTSCIIAMSYLWKHMNYKDSDRKKT